MATQIYPMLLNRYPDLMKHVPNVPTFANDKYVLPLQAADMLAWHLRRRSENPNEHLPLYENLSVYHAGHHIEQEFVEKTFGLITQVPGVSRISTRAGWKKIKRQFREEAASGAWRKHPFAAQVFKKRQKIGTRLVRYLRSKFFNE